MKTKLLLALTFLALSAKAQIFYDFGTSTYSGAATSGVPTGWTAGDVTVGNTIKPDNYFTNTSTSNNNSGTYTNPNPSGNGNVTMIANAGVQVISTLSYFEVVITPKTTEKVKITNITYGSRSIGSSGGPTTVIIRSSVDNYATDLANHTINSVSLWSQYSETVNVTGALSTAVTLRIYAADATGSTTSNNWRIDDLSITAVDGVLPVSLISFTGKADNNAVTLNWKTASEKNNSHFDIERSINGKIFEKIGSVSGAGNSDQLKTYAFNDATAENGVNYYQLKQVDNNGDFEIFSAISVTTALAKSEFSVLALSAKSEVQIVVNGVKPGAGEIEIYNLSGQRIANASVNLVQGYNKVAIPVTIINSGIYVAKLKVNSQVLTKKFVIN